MRDMIFSLFRVLFASLALATAGLADDLAEPQGDVLLTVSGDIDVTNGDGKARFDRDMLEALEQREIRTATIWTEGVQVFTGVPLKTLADRLGIDGGTLRAIAVNDYAIEIPFSDVEEDVALLAMTQNGAPMTVRNNGPLWIIYPFDSDPEFRTESYHARSIWQLVALEVVP